MSQTQKLYQRLDRVEAQYSILLREELEAMLHGSLGHYLGGKLRQDWHRAVSTPPDDRAVELRSLEKTIRGLRSKLGEPLPGERVDVAEALVRRLADAGEWSPGTNKAWLREAIARITQQGSP